MGTIRTKKNQAHRERIMEASRTIKNPAPPRKSIQRHRCRSSNRRSSITHNCFAGSLAASEKSRRNHPHHSSTGRRRRSGASRGGGAAWSPKRGRTTARRGAPWKTVSSAVRRHTTSSSPQREVTSRKIFGNSEAPTACERAGVLVSSPGSFHAQPSTRLS